MEVDGGQSGEHGAMKHRLLLAEFNRRPPHDPASHAFGGGGEVRGRDRPRREKPRAAFPEVNVGLPKRPTICDAPRRFFIRELFSAPAGVRGFSHKTWFRIWGGGHTPGSLSGRGAVEGGQVNRGRLWSCIIRP